MTRIDAAERRLQQASDLAEVLDAVYESFEAMLSVIHGIQDPASGWFAAYVMAAASAANGRNAVALAPSLPRSPLSAVPAEQGPWPGEPPELVTELVAGLSQLVAGRLAAVGVGGPDVGDQGACEHAARSAREICELLSSRP